MSRGMNMYGFFEQNNPNLKNFTKELEEQLFLEQIEKKRKRRKINLKRVGENILGANKIKSLPWE